MHELAICQSIADGVRRHSQGRSVQTIHLRIGTLRQVVPETLEFCWSLVTEGSDLAGAELAVERVNARIHCPSCQQDSAITALAMACPACGSVAVDVVAGNEFLITALELTKGVTHGPIPPARRAAPA